MRRSTPALEDILEGLADKVVGQIERLATLSFDGALRELVSYHHFLLALSVASTSDGVAFSTAQIYGNAWSAPHSVWLRQYSRLFERAAARLSDNDHFVRTLAYTPHRLLQGHDSPLPATVSKEILDLGPMLALRLASWRTKRAVVESAQGRSAQARVELSGSDATAYANLMPEVVGAWESLLRRASTIYAWPDTSEADESTRWRLFGEAWPYLWQHLANTAYSLAVAVWNEDETGATLFSEALVRWPHTLDPGMDHDFLLRNQRLVLPKILELSLRDARESLAPLLYELAPPPSPESLLASVTSGVHRDVLVISSALFLHWSMHGQQSTDIGSRTANSLLGRRDSDDDVYDQPSPFEFQPLFLDVMRIEIAGRGHVDGTHRATLDGLVEHLDQMRERRVVPGRIFTPSTLNDASSLLPAFISLLLTRLPATGDGGVVAACSDLAEREHALPDGDSSLRDALRHLERMRSSLSEGGGQLGHSLTQLATDAASVAAVARLRVIVEQSIAAIEARRSARIAERSVDQAKLDRFSARIEEALLTEPPEVPFFIDVVFGAAGSEAEASEKHFRLGEISKAQLLEPAMDDPPINLEESLVAGARMICGLQGWESFKRKARLPHQTHAQVDSAAFWEEIGRLGAEAGPNPALVVSRGAAGGAIRRISRSAREGASDFAVETRRRGQYYIATINGVDVYGAGFPETTAWLFSAKMLVSVRYADTGRGRRATLAYEPDTATRGFFDLCVHQALEWREGPIFEISMPPYVSPDQ